jgi:hypothetical protein
MHMGGVDMTDLRSHNGWLRLNSGFDLGLVHGIPVILSDNGLTGSGDDAELDDEVSSLSGLRSTILGWHECDHNEGQETLLCIDALQFEEVLKRLAIASAALFVDRFHKTIGADAVDWDKMEYDRDFNKAIKYCCLESTDYNKVDFFSVYRDCMHHEANRLIEEAVNPLVEPE